MKSIYELYSWMFAARASGHRQAGYFPQSERSTPDIVFTRYTGINTVRGFATQQCDFDVISVSNFKQFGLTDKVIAVIDEVNEYALIIRAMLRQTILTAMGDMADGHDTLIHSSVSSRYGLMQILVYGGRSKEPYYKHRVSLEICIIRHQILSRAELEYIGQARYQLK